MREIEVSTLNLPKCHYSWNSQTLKHVNGLHLTGDSQKFDVSLLTFNNGSFLSGEEDRNNDTDWTENEGWWRELRSPSPVTLERPEGSPT